MFKKILKAAMLTVCVAVIPGTLGINAEAKPKSLSKNVKVGDTVYFGKYEQDADTGNGAERLVWRVLAKKGGKALIVTESLIDMQLYHNAAEGTTWEKSYIRKWLNKEYVNSAFSASDKKKLQSTKVVNKDNPEYNTDGGKDTTDKVFLLSIDEAKKYFKSDDDRRATVTDHYKSIYRQYYINEQGKTPEEADAGIRYIEGMGNCDYYWLRSPGISQDEAVYVNEDGSVYDGGYYTYVEMRGIRPALWVKL